MFNNGLNKNALISYTPVLPDLSWAISLNVNSFNTSKNCRLVGGSSSSFWAEVSSPLKLYKIPSLKNKQAKRIIWQTYLSPLSESLDRWWFPQNETILVILISFRFGWFSRKLPTTILSKWQGCGQTPSLYPPTTSFVNVAIQYSASATS